MTNKPRSSGLSARRGGLRQLYGNPEVEKLNRRIAELEQENRWYRIAAAITNPVTPGKIELLPTDVPHVEPQHLENMAPISRSIQ